MPALSGIKQGRTIESCGLGQHSTSIAHRRQAGVLGGIRENVYRLWHVSGYIRNRSMQLRSRWAPRPLPEIGFQEDLSPAPREKVGIYFGMEGTRFSLISLEMFTGWVEKMDGRPFCRDVCYYLYTCAPFHMHDRLILNSFARERRTLYKEVC